MRWSALSHLRPSLNFPRAAPSEKVNPLLKQRTFVLRQIILPLPIHFFCQSEIGHAYFLKASSVYSLLCSVLKNRTCKSPSESQTQIGGEEWPKGALLYHFPICLLAFFFFKCQAANRDEAFKFLNILWNKSFAMNISSPSLFPVSVSRTLTHLCLRILAEPGLGRQRLSHINAAGV